MPIPKVKSSESKQEFIEKCMSDETMTDEYEQDQRMAICTDQWEQSLEEQEQMRICTEVSGDVHRETKYGREYLVAPVVAVTEGILKGEFLPSEEIKNAASIFNDKPLPIGHPKDDNGEPLSAQKREIIENQSVGRFWDVHYEDNRLKGNLWVDIQKAEELGGQAEEVLNKLENNEQVDVSTAYWPDVEESSGIYNGEKYEGVQRNLTPDHLALLPEAKGECSWEDGCGAPRINSEGDYMEVNASRPSYNGTEDKDWSGIKKTFAAFKSALDLPDESWSDLTDSQRNEIKGHFIDQSGDTFTALGYPVVNPNSGKLNRGAVANAKTRASAAGAGDVESTANSLWDDEFAQEQQAQNIAGKIWNNLKQHFRGEQEMSEREGYVMVLEENGVNVEDVGLGELDDKDVERWANAYTENEEEQETNESNEEDERVETLEEEVKELKEKLETQEAEKLDSIKETIVANSDWDKDELEDFDEGKLEKMADMVAPKTNMQGKAQPRSYDEDDEVEEREPVIANKSEMESE